MRLYLNLIKIVESSGALLALLLTLLNSSGSHAGEVYQFQQAELSDWNSFRHAVAGFAAGDEVQVLDQTQVILDVKLSSLLGEGAYGRVFLIEERSISRARARARARVIKFQRGSENARTAMLEEVGAFKRLAPSRVPHSRVLEQNQNFYLIKEYVPGNTLGEVVGLSWYRMSSKLQAATIIKLHDLKRQLYKAKLNFSDLNSGNIIFDQDEQVWKIVDPGAEEDAPFSLLAAEESFSWLEAALSMGNLDSETSEMVTTFEWVNESRQNKICIEPYLRLLKIMEFYEIGEVEKARKGYTANLSRVVAGLLQDDKCPAEFNELWERVDLLKSSNQGSPRLSVL